MTRRNLLTMLALLPLAPKPAAQASTALPGWSERWHLRLWDGKQLIKEYKDWNGPGWALFMTLPIRPSPNGPIECWQFKRVTRTGTPIDYQRIPSRPSCRSM